LLLDIGDHATRARAKAGPVMRALLAVNYAHLDEPPPTRIDHQLE
jgi:hypothetical protein